MQNVKRLEIVTDAVELKDLCAALERHGVGGYTIIRDVIGQGHRGARSGDELTDVFKNCYVLVVCEAELVSPLIEEIRPILKRFGGLCLVSDAQSVIH